VNLIKCLGQKFTQRSELVGHVQAAYEILQRRARSKLHCNRRYACYAHTKDDVGANEFGKRTHARLISARRLACESQRMQRIVRLEELDLRY
jgi:hypothetical protein